MVKKIICLITVLLLCFSFSVSAEDELLVYGEADVELFCEAFGMDAAEIKHYLEQNSITYLAINRDNTKQVKRTEFTDEFSKKIVDFSVLEDSEILMLTKEISGFQNAKGKIVKNGDHKFLKLELKTTDSGGEYILTQYLTVKNAKKITLTFYTDKCESLDYIDAVFKAQFAPKTDYKPYIIGGVVVFAVASIAALVFLILDFKKPKEE